MRRGLTGVCSVSQRTGRPACSQNFVKSVNSVQRVVVSVGSTPQFSIMPNHCSTDTQAGWGERWEAGGGGGVHVTTCRGGMGGSRVALLTCEYPRTWMLAGVSSPPIKGTRCLPSSSSPHRVWLSGDADADAAAVLALLAVVALAPAPAPAPPPAPDILCGKKERGV